MKSQGSTTRHSDLAIEHPGEEASNEVRRRAASVEPRGLRTYTPSQLVIARSEGCFHFTPEGRRLLDMSSGVLVANLGHNPAGWWRRVFDYLQLAEIPKGDGYVSAAPLTSYNAIIDLEVRAAERLLQSLREAPGGRRCEQVLWAASGSEAIQKALWAAWAFRPERPMILATRYGFHGKKGLAGAVTGDEQDAERDARVRFLRFPQEECRNVDRRRQALDLEPFRRELGEAWDQLDGKIGSLVTEPYLGGGGSFHPQPEYLQLLQAFCQEHDILFILDEIQSNFGRTGSMYAFTTYGIEPDIVVLGKGLGNGVPVSATAGPAEVLGALGYGAGSDTWSANPLSSAAVLATLDEFERPELWENAAELSQTLERGLRRLSELPVVAHIRGEGTVWGVECAATSSLTAGETANACVEACYRGDEQGRALHLLGPLADCVLRVSPPLTTPPEIAEEYLEAMYGIFANIG